MIQIGFIQCFIIFRPAHIYTSNILNTNWSTHGGNTSRELTVFFWHCFRVQSVIICTKFSVELAEPLNNWFPNCQRFVNVQLVDLLGRKCSVSEIDIAAAVSLSVFHWGTARHSNIIEPVAREIHSERVLNVTHHILRLDSEKSFAFGTKEKRD